MKKLFIYLLPIVSFLLGIKGYQLCNSLLGQEIIFLRDSVPYEEIADMEQEIVKNGDKDSYHKLESYYVRKKIPLDEFVIYSMIMANKYDYPQACWDVYWQLVYLNDSVDFKTLSIGLGFLRHGVELNSSSCLRELGQLYLEGKYVAQNDSLGNDLLKKAENIRKGKTNE